VRSVTDGYDSQTQNSRLLATFQGLHHEAFITDLSANVIRGQTENLEAGLSNGDYCFGYDSVAVEDAPNVRRGKNRKVPRRYVVHEEKAEWVKRIFHWFVRERRTIRWITRELNRLGAPKDHRARHKTWRHPYVAALLANTKYIGTWSWGRKRTVRDPEGRRTTENRSVEETNQWLRHIPSLQIVDDETFELAQQLLRENTDRFQNRSPDGRLNGGPCGIARSPRHLLSGLLVCEECGAPMVVGGTQGLYWKCQNYADGLCSCKTTVQRELAQKLVLEAIGNHILHNSDWTTAVFHATQMAWHDSRKSLPGELEVTKAALVKIESKITALLDQIEDRQGDSGVIQKRLNERLVERQRLEQKLAALSKSGGGLDAEPTLEWVEKQLLDLTTVLGQAAPAAAHALRALVGGQILVEQIKRPGRKRHFLRAKFIIDVTGVLQSLAIPGAVSPVEPAEMCTIDLLHPNPMDELSEKVKKLSDSGMPDKEIVRTLGLYKDQVRLLLKHWSKRHGVDLPNGFARRAERTRKQLAPARIRALSEEVMKPEFDKMHYEDIAAELGINRDDITAAVAYWHRVRDLPVPDGRARRKTLPKKPRHADGGTSSAA
jgi:hypothetical protein